MSQRKPRTRAEAKQAQASRTPASRSSRRGAAASTGPLARAGSGCCAGCGRCSASVPSAWSGSVSPTRAPTSRSPTRSPTAQASIVYYADGKTEMARLSDAEGNRESVPLSKVPDHMQKAMLAAEDQDFYQNNGISPTGIARAVWVAVKGGQATQGGSTITQQYVKNYFLTQDRTLTRKAREILISVKIDQQQTKDEILENYLNTIYYGRGAYGIQTASKAYFNKDVSKLTPAESAFLASVIRGAVALRPGPGRGAAGQRRGALGLHPRRDGREGLAQPGRARRGHVPRRSASTSRATQCGPDRLPHRDGQERARHQAQDPRGRHRPRWPAHRLDDRQRSQAAPRWQRRSRTSGPRTADVHVGMASIKPGDGAIVALYGGADYSKRQQNAATQDKMQAGSTFKIFTLIAALQSGDVSLKSRFDGASPQYFEEFADPDARRPSAGRRGRVKNFGDESFGQIDLRRRPAARSTPSTPQLNIDAGPEKSMKAAEDAGCAQPARGQHGQRARHRLRHRARHGQRLRDDRRRGRAGRPVHRQGDPVPRRERADDQGRGRRPSRSSTRTSCPTSSTR